jgi:hypothetical protein
MPTFQRKELVKAGKKTAKNSGSAISLPTTTKWSHKRTSSNQVIQIAKNLLEEKVCDKCKFFMSIYNGKKKPEEEFCYFGSWYDGKKEKVRLPENIDVPENRTCRHWKLRGRALEAPWDP